MKLAAIIIFLLGLAIATICRTETRRSWGEQISAGLLSAGLALFVMSWVF